MNKNKKNIGYEDKVLVIRPNKTQLKIESDALLKTGEQLVALKTEELSSIELPDNLANAVAEARRIKSRSGLKRQRLYIGKLMRFVDHESIAHQLAKIQHKHDTNTAGFKKTEQWRDRLLRNDKEAMTELIHLYPTIDRQHVNQLVRLALREKQGEKPPIAARKLFKYLREIEDSQQAK